MDNYSPSHPTEQDMDVATDDEGTPVKDEIKLSKEEDISVQLYSEINPNVSPSSDSKNSNSRSHKKTSRSNSRSRRKSSRSNSRERRRRRRSSRRSKSRHRNRSRSRSHSRRRRSHKRKSHHSSHKRRYDREKSGSRSYNRNRSRSRSHRRSRSHDRHSIKDRKSSTPINSSFMHNSPSSRDRFNSRPNSRFDTPRSNNSNNNMFGGKNYDLDKSYDRRPPSIPDPFIHQAMMPIPAPTIQQPPPISWPINQPPIGIPFVNRPGFPPPIPIIKDPMLPAIFDPTVPPPPPPPLSAIISMQNQPPPPPPSKIEEIPPKASLPKPNILQTLISQAGLSSLPEFSSCPNNTTAKSDDMCIDNDNLNHNNNHNNRDHTDDIDYDNDENEMSPLKKISSLLNNAASNLIPCNENKSRTDTSINNTSIFKNSQSTHETSQTSKGNSQNVDWKAIAQLFNRSDFATNREWQDRIALEVKSYLKPAFVAKKITKDDYMEIMKKSVTKISRSGIKRIESEKIGNFVKLYIKKYRRAHKKEEYLNMIQQKTTDQSEAPRSLSMN